MISVPQRTPLKWFDHRLVLRHWLSFFIILYSDWLIDYSFLWSVVFERYEQQAVATDTVVITDSGGPSMDSGSLIVSIRRKKSGRFRCSSIQINISTYMTSCSKKTLLYQKTPFDNVHFKAQFNAKPCRLILRSNGNNEIILKSIKIILTSIFCVEFLISLVSK